MSLTCDAAINDKKKKEKQNKTEIEYVLSYKPFCRFLILYPHHHHHHHYNNNNNKKNNKNKNKHHHQLQQQQQQQVEKEQAHQLRQVRRWLP